MVSQIKFKIKIYFFLDRLSTNETGALWLPFQTAAGTVTTLYKGKYTILIFKIKKYIISPQGAQFLPPCWFHPYIYKALDSHAMYLSCNRRNILKIANSNLTLLT